MNFETPHNSSKSSKEKVSPESDEYLDTILERQEVNTTIEHGECFGIDILARHNKNVDMYDAIQDVSDENHIPYSTLFRLSHPGKDPSVHFKEQNRALSLKSQQLFSRFTSKSSSRYFAGKFVEQSLKDPWLTAQLERVIQELPKDEHERKTPDVGMLNIAEAALLIENSKYAEQIRARKLKSAKILEAISQNRIPPEVWFVMLKLHKESYIKKKEAVLELIPKFKEQLRNAYVRKSESSDLFPIDVRRLDVLLDSLSFDVGDGIHDAFESNGGSFDPESNTIILSAQHLDNPLGGDDQLYKVFVHEVIHAFSGKTIVKETKISDEVTDVDEADWSNEYELTNYSLQRLGLHITHRFRWLNEAVTETLAKELTQDDENEFTSYSYKAERGILRHIIETYEIPLSLFSKAFFEHYEPDNRDTDAGAISNWKELYRVINERCGTGYLLALDKKIKEKGASQVLADLKEQQKLTT